MVVTNRTVATIPAARAQARYFFRAVLIKGLPPYKLSAVFSGKTLRFNETYGYVLGELGGVSVDDLHHFVDTHNIPMPEREKRGEIFKKVIDETTGRYEPTLERLKEIDREYWRPGLPIRVCSSSRRSTRRRVISPTICSTSSTRWSSG
ncbi:MAG: hypothetical protein ACREXX_22545 [Gammaproteobacteria bacterium]